MQLVVLVFAVGLALAAYSSLIESGKRIRAVFAIASMLALAMGLVSYIMA